MALHRGAQLLNYLTTYYLLHFADYFLTDRVALPRGAQQLNYSLTTTHYSLLTLLTAYYSPQVALCRRIQLL